MLNNTLMKTAEMDKLISSIIDSIRQRCFVFAFKNNPYDIPFNSKNDLSHSSLVDETHSSNFYENMNAISSKVNDNSIQPGFLQSKGLPPGDFDKAAEHYNAGNFDEAERICIEIINSEPHGDSYNLLAQIEHKKGNYEKSIKFMHKALEFDQTSSMYNNNLGNILFEQGNFETAAKFFSKAIEYRKDYAEAHFNLGLAEVRLGNQEKALFSFKTTIQLRPDICDAYTNIGNIYMDMNKTEAAIDIYRKALTLKPQDMVISVNLNLALQAINELEEAEKVLSDALEYSPDSPELLLNLGNIYQNSNNSSKAIACYQKALKAAPNDEKIHYNLGTTFMESGQYTDAIPCFEATLKRSPENTQALNNMGLVHFKIGNNQTALTYYEKAINLRDDFAEVHNNIGLVYKLLEQKKKAMYHFERAIEIDPQFGEPFHNLAEIQRESHLYDEAFENSIKAIALEPDLTPAYTHHSYLLKWLCEWEEYDRIKEQLDLLVTKEIDTGKIVRETPFMNLIRVDDPVYNRKVADHFAHKISEKAKNLKAEFLFEKCRTNRKKNSKQKITVGYISANFRYHPLAHLLANLFRHHNRDEFQVNCYSMGPDDGSEYRKRFVEDSDIFRDIRNLNHVESAQQIFDDKVDILVDLMGYTQGSRLEINALRPAPIQVRYMGMPGTMGGNLFDYIIVDEIVLPRDQQKHYSEKFIYMPYTYQINDRSKKISQEPVTRQMFNLPEDSFVFCSFNTSYKTDPVIFSAWMDILRQTENSVLWLMPDIKRAGYNMHKVAAKNGINPERIIYTDNIPLEKHLARIGLADLALDTLAVGGAATTSDALWGGVPVITMLGNRFISRMSASILSAIGLDELITTNLDDYTKLAIKFAQDRAALRQLKAKLKHNIQTMPLFDTPGFTLHLERGFKQIWDIYISGGKPQIIDLKENMA